VMNTQIRVVFDQNRRERCLFHLPILFQFMSAAMVKFRLDHPPSGPSILKVSETWDSLLELAKASVSTSECYGKGLTIG
jgi:hypothetical protein